MEENPASNRLVAALAEPALILDADGLVVRANAAAAALLGRDGEELAGTAIDTLIAGIDSGSPHVAGERGELVPLAVHIGELGEAQRLLSARDVSAERRIASQLADAERIAGLAIWEWHVPTDTVVWSREAYRLFSQPESAEPTYELWLESIHPDDRGWVADYVQGSFASHEDYDFEHRVLHPDGSVRHLHCRGQVILGADGDPERLVGVSQDVTERVLQQEELARAAALQQAVLDAAGEGICGLDREGRITFVNPAAAELLGESPGALAGQPLVDRLHSRSGGRHPLARAIAEGSPLHDERAVLHREDGGGSVVGYHCSPIGGGAGPAGAVVTFSDASERVRYEEQLRHLAEHDALTGLLNRRRFEAEVAAQAVYADRYGGSYAVLVLDLDHFKDVNDTRGHGSGDALIRTSARALGAALPPEAVLARLGGDEFAVLLPAADERSALEVGEALRAGIAEHLLLAGGERLSVTASIGIAVPERASDPPTSLLSDADVAMYDAKENGRNRVTLYRPELGARARMEARLAWSTRLRQALEGDAFELYAQPIIPLGPGPREKRFEVLLRMRVEDGTLALPAAFLPVAERHGLIREIDRWVVSRVASIAARHSAGPEPLRLEVNLSGQSMVDPELPAFIGELLRESGAQPSQLIFEVTETTAIDSLHEARALAEGLVELGCEFAIDDFGAGFGSFAYLKHLPSQYVKIDGDFIRRLPTSPNDQLVVQAIATIAAGMGKRTIAEFVETEETLRMLGAIGIDFAQGIVTGRPGPIDEVLGEAGVLRRVRPAS